MNSIFTRCSIRKFKKTKIEKEKQELILKAAFAAPSAKNAQPWEFLVIEDEDELARMSTFTPYAKPLENAALGIVVLGNLQRNDMIDFCEQDCAAATQNMLVEANELGIGSVWMGVYPVQEKVQVLKTHFQLPDYVVPLWMIAFGYPDQEPKIKDKYNTNYIHYHHW